MTSLNEAFAPPSAEELVRAAQYYSGSAQGSASDDLVAPRATGRACAPLPSPRPRAAGRDLAL